MSYGINIINADSYLTFNEDKIYYQFEEKLESSKATVLFPSRFYWDTTYTGSKYPIVFIHSNGYWASIIDTYRLANNKWRIEVWTEGSLADATKNNITGYLIEKGNSEEYIKKLSLLLNDEKRRAIMGESGREFIEENFNWSKIAKEFLIILKNI